MHIILSVYGSAGDVHPLAGLALALKARGHRITFIVNEYFRELVERAGLDYVELGTTAQFHALSANPDLWHPLRSFGVIVNNGIAPLMRQEYELIAERYAAGETVAVSTCLGFGTRLAHERLGIPLVSVLLQPAALWSEHQTPRLPCMLAGPRVPRWLKRLQFRAGERWFIKGAVLPKLNALRKELGLSLVARTTEWWHKADRVVCLFPEWYAPRQPDWPANVDFAQFPLWDESEVSPSQPALDEFLEQHGRPIVFTPGSAMRHGQSFFAAAVEACRLLDRPGMLLSRFAEHIPAGLPANVQHFEYVPFSQVLNRAAGIVHHGGIGTTSQALRAGIPQLIMPMAYDQPDNAARLKRLGVGDWVKPAAFTGANVAAALGRLLQSEVTQRCCEEVAAKFHEVDPFAAACEVVETTMSQATAAFSTRASQG